ncbi:hypothetical protein AYI70_g7147 [Smittium culicis]|uniref:Flavin-nucleotide-binding protein n=1 Tax=Smittium culicis TaxID=133412 RepID=A0A1R1XLX8_9FUNG|nr:hypothetical protein AYI70_g7147 [Smittium culicis]
MATYEPKSSKEINFVRRLRDRARYDHETVNSILDAGKLAYVGFKVPQKKSKTETETELETENDEDQYPNVIPMIYGRSGQTIYLHGYISGRLLKALSGPPKGSNSIVPAPKACITVTIVDALVVSLSAMHNSNNFRSVCCFGSARLVEDYDEKVVALTEIVDHQFFGGKKWDDSRPVHEHEVKSTRVIAIDIEAASAKIRNGDPTDDKVDTENPEFINKIWSGVVPVKTVYGKAKPSWYNNAPVPDYIEKLYNASL